MATELFPARVPCKEPCTGKARMKWKFDVKGLPKGVVAVATSKCPTCRRIALHFSGQPESHEEFMAFVEAYQEWSGNKGDLHLTDLPSRR